MVSATPNAKPELVHFLHLRFASKCSGIKVLKIFVLRSRRLQCPEQIIQIQLQKTLLGDTILVTVVVFLYSFAGRENVLCGETVAFSKTKFFPPNVHVLNFARGHGRIAFGTNQCISIAAVIEFQKPLTSRVSWALNLSETHRGFGSHWTKFVDSFIIFRGPIFWQGQSSTNVQLYLHKNNTNLSTISLTRKAFSLFFGFRTSSQLIEYSLQKFT